VGQRRGGLASGLNTRPSGREQNLSHTGVVIMDRRTCLVPHRSAREIFSSLNSRVLINVSSMTHSWCTSVAEVKSSRYILLGWILPGGLSPQVSLVVCVGLSSVVRCRSLFSFFLFFIFSLDNYYFSMAYFVFFNWIFNRKLPKLYLCDRILSS
jgi:hypothetical protein